MLLAANSAIRVSELAAELGVTTQTIRRDLDDLSQRGEINRTYGGASSRPMGVEPSLMERQKFGLAERELIAKTAVQLIEDGETLMISAGVTTRIFAQQLAIMRNKLQVFTNSLSVATILANNSSHRIVLIPGEYDSQEGCVCGAESLSFLNKFRADTAVFGASGIYEEGVCEVHSGLAWVDRAMIERSQRRILLLPHTKFNEPHMELVCTVSEIDTLVVDRMPDGRLLEILDDGQVNIVEAIFE